LPSSRDEWSEDKAPPVARVGSVSHYSEVEVECSADDSTSQERPHTCHRDYRRACGLTRKKANRQSAARRTSHLTAAAAGGAAASSATDAPPPGTPAVRRSTAPSRSTALRNVTSTPRTAQTRRRLRSCQRDGRWFPWQRLPLGADARTLGTRCRPSALAVRLPAERRSRNKLEKPMNVLHRSTASGT
jgi:hypothetical protein